MDDRFTFWFRWLLVVVAGVLVLGASLVVLPGPMSRLFESLYYVPRFGALLPAGPAAYTAFLQGVLGAVLFGWGMLLLAVLLGPFRRLERSAWNMLAVSLAAWFVPDTLFSLFSGFATNVLPNLAFAAAFALPLAATYRLFPARPRD